jgi:hypothetical protein
MSVSHMVPDTERLQALGRHAEMAPTQGFKPTIKTLL